MKTRMRTWMTPSLPVALALLACAAPVRASTGGPTLLDVPGWSAAGRRVRVHVVPANAGDRFHRSDVAVKSVFQVPGRRERLVVVSFIGDCAEGGHETREPVLLADPDVRIRHAPWRGGG